MFHAVTGRDLPVWMSAAFLLLVILQVSLHFFIFYDRQPAGIGGQFFPPRLNHQNIDTPGWVLAGVMLPGNAPKVRAMRPMYPFAVTLAKAVGFVPVDPAIAQAPPGSEAYGMAMVSFPRAIAVLLFTNALFALVSGWLFFAFCRAFGMAVPAAACAALAAGSGFGFSFWVVQATPDMIGNVTVIVTLVAAAIAWQSTRHVASQSADRKHQIATAIRWAMVGLVVGLALLCKESFNLPIFVGLLLLLTRQWIALVAFSALALLPSILWNYYMARIVKAFNPTEYLNQYKFVVWLWRDLGPLPWSERAAAILKNGTQQLVCLGRAFAYIPLLLAAAGLVLGRNTIPRRFAFTALFFVSLYLLFLASNFIMPRLMFLSWPVVYFFAWVAVEKVASLVDPNTRSDWRNAAPGSASSTAAWVVRGVALAGLLYLGTRDHFQWFYYG